MKVEKSTARLRKLLKRPGIVVAPGAYDSLSAKLIEQAGFEAIYMTGFGASASVLGAPDFGLLTMEEMVRHASRMAAAVGIPVIADADNGYGNPINVYRTIKEYERAGVAGCHLEDQSLPKRCGHMDGKQVIPAAQFIDKIKAATDSRQDPDFVIIARTDARTVIGFEEALDRASAYAEAGVDMIFLESPLSVYELETAARTIKAPLIANMAEGGKTPMLPVAELERMGYKLVIFPIGLLLTATKAMQRALEFLRETGTYAGALGDMLGFKEFTNLMSRRPTGSTRGFSAAL
ncbi:MAG: isocitrate lyase/PEP mutase family protein [Firmicutes bacterium]|nr:isocitrate lyase/PEP mutase family protein [Bacillota bacterium]